MKELLEYLDHLEKATQQEVQAVTRLTRKLNNLFGSVFNTLPQRIEELGIQDEQELRRLIRRHFGEIEEDYLEVLREEGRGVAQGAGQRTVHHLRSAGLAVEYDDVSGRLLNALDNATFRASRQTMNRMTGDVMGVIRSAREQGLSSTEATEMLRGSFEKMQDYELNRIARTEINNYSNMSAYETEKHFDVEYHQWITADDGRVRGDDPSDEADHIELHLQIVPVGRTFSNGLKYPGDKEGLIDEIINCRCRVVPFIMPPDKIAPFGRTRFYEDDLIRKPNLTTTRKALKGGQGSGNWGHDGQAGSWGGSSETGGASDTFLKHPGELRHSFNPEDGSFSGDRHLHYCDNLSEAEYSEYMEELEDYILDDESDMEMSDISAISSDANAVEIRESHFKVQKLNESLYDEIGVEKKDKADYLVHKHGLVDDPELREGTFEMFEDAISREVIHESLGIDPYDDPKWIVRDNTEETLEKLKYMKDTYEAEGMTEDALRTAVEETLEGEELEKAEELIDEKINDKMGERGESVLKQWAYTSGDDNYQAIATQIAVAENFGLSNAMLDHYPDRTVDNARNYYDSNKKFLNKFIEAQYDETQERLAEAGIDKVVAYRGMRFHPFRDGVPESMSHIDIPKSSSYAEVIERGTVPVDTRSQPLSSYATDPLDTKGFARAFEGETGMIVASEVPAEKVLSLHSCGFGCHDESEITVMSENIRGDALVWEAENWDDNMRHEEIMMSHESDVEHHLNRADELREEMVERFPEEEQQWAREKLNEFVELAPGKWEAMEEKKEFSQRMGEEEIDTVFDFLTEYDKAELSRDDNRIREQENLPSLFDTLTSDDKRTFKFAKSNPVYREVRKALLQDRYLVGGFKEAGITKSIITETKEILKGGTGSGNWGHDGQAGSWGGSSETGGTSEEFLEIDPEVRYSFDPETGEFDVNRHLDKLDEFYEDAETNAEYLEAQERQEEYEEKVAMYREAGVTERLDASPAELIDEQGNIELENVAKATAGMSTPEKLEYKREVMEEYTKKREEMADELYAETSSKEILGEPPEALSGDILADSDYLYVAETGAVMYIDYMEKSSPTDTARQNSNNQITGPENKELLREFANKETLKEQQDFIENEITEHVAWVDHDFREDRANYAEFQEAHTLLNACQSSIESYTNTDEEFREKQREALIGAEENGVGFDYDYQADISPVAMENIDEGSEFYEKFANGEALNTVPVEIFESETGRAGVKQRHRQTPGVDHDRWAEYKATPDMSVDTAVHEFGHVIHRTEQNEGVQQAVNEMFVERTEGKELTEIFEDSGEMGYQGAFDHHYTGKVYDHDEPGAMGAEVFSMGVQRLYSNPTQFKESDREHYNLTLGILKGIY